MCVDFHSVVGGHVPGGNFSCAKKNGGHFKKRNVCLCKRFVLGMVTSVSIL